MHAMLARLRPALGLAGGLVVLLLAGCGASGSASTAGASAAKARFVADAQSVCRTLKAQEQPLKARQESLKGQPTAVADKAFVSVARQVAALSRAADGKLQALPRPAADAHAIAGLLTSFSQEIADVSDVANAVAENQPAIGESADAALRKSIAQNSALADAYGMNACVGSE
jgi:hypothetical protein